MPSKYNRKNRDRRGGHEVTPIAMREGVVHVDPKMKAFVKHHSMKLVRRQHAQAIAQGVAEYDQMLKDACFGYDTDFQDVDAYLDRKEFEDYQAGYPDDDQEDPYDFYDYDDRYDYQDSLPWDPYYGEDDYLHPIGRRYPSDDLLTGDESTIEVNSALCNVIKREHAGMTLGELLRRHLNN